VNRRPADRPAVDRPAGLRAWRPALRIARRDLLRSKGRNALVVSMVGIPVLLICTGSILLATGDVSAREALPGQLGRAQAAITPAGRAPIDQDLEGSFQQAAGPVAPDVKDDSWTADQVRQAVGRPVLDVMTGQAGVRTANGRAQVSVQVADTADPLLAGFAPLRSGRRPGTDDEVLITPALRQKGFDVGDRLPLVGDGSGSAASSTDPPGVDVTVVGVASSSQTGPSPAVLARPGSPAAQLIEADAEHVYLVTGGEPVGWPQVRRLNQLGLAVLSRDVVTSPPADWRSDLSTPDAGLGGRAGGVGPVLGLVAFSVVLEVILLAGPAYAVGARRQRRRLALLTAVGGTARDVRRVVLAQGLTTGAAAAVLGAGLAIPLTAAMVWLAPRLWPTIEPGPLDLPVATLAGVAALGAGSAVAAALIPAHAAARQDVVAVLAGRSGQPPPPARVSALGLALLGAGIAVILLLGIRRGGEVWVAAGTVPLVLGAIAVMPSVIAGLGRAGSALPLPLRLATRDSARNRGRTAPAVAAVMAVVAGATALAIGMTSDQAQSRREYRNLLPMGVTTIEAWQASPAWWRAAPRTTEQAVPGRRLLLTGELGDADPGSRWRAAAYVAPPGCPQDLPGTPANQAERCATWAQGPGQDQGSDNLVAEPEALKTLGYRLDAEQLAVLNGGGVLVPRGDIIDLTGRVTLHTYQAAYSDSGSQVRAQRTHHLRAALVAPRIQQDRPAPVGAIMTPSTATSLGLGWAPTQGVLNRSDTALTKAQQDRLGEALLGSADSVTLYTERGYPDQANLLLLVLGGVCGLLVLVGTLTATGLALADGQADAVTLAAVGARPRTRRAMAAAQAAVIGLLGAGAGVGVGAVPGLAVTWPLTAPDGSLSGNGEWGDPTIVVPWLMLLGIGIGVPLVAATVAAVTTRTRVPLTHRLGQ
jgi:putative ABC transport system permease protein